MYRCTHFTHWTLPRFDLVSDVVPSSMASGAAAQSCRSLLRQSNKRMLCRSWWACSLHWSICSSSDKRWKRGFVLKVSKMQCLIADDLKSQHSCFNAILSFFFFVRWHSLSPRHASKIAHRETWPNLGRHSVESLAKISLIQCGLTDSDRLPACLTHQGFPQICSATALFKASNFVLLKVTKDVKAENVVLHGERAVLIDFGIVPSLQFLDPVSLNCSNCLLPCRSRISMISLCFPRPVELMMKWEWKNELDHRAMLHQRSSHTDPTTKRLPSSISVCIFAFAIMIYSQISGSWGRNMEE